MLGLLMGVAAVTSADCPPRQARGCTESQGWNQVVLSGEWPTDPSQDSVYWQPPTRITTSLDGNVLITVHRLANMARMPSLFDQGYLIKFWVHVDFYGDSECAGPVIHANNYEIASLNYKEDRPDVTATVYDQRLRDLGGAPKCMKSSFHWEG